MVKLWEKDKNMFFPMMGLHPCSVKENYKDVLAHMESLLDNIPYAGIGEIGIDLYWDKSFKKEQEEAFRIQIEWSRSRSLPFVIHSRDSLHDTIRIVEELQDGSLKGIFHCFTGDESQARRIMDAGFYLGIGGVLTFKNSNLKEVIKMIGLSQLVLETDAPFLAPVPFRGKRNQSDYIPIIAEFLADHLNKSTEEIAEVTSNNALQVFG